MQKGVGALETIRRAQEGGRSAVSDYPDSGVRAQWIYSVAPLLVPSCMVIRQAIPQIAAPMPPTMRRDASHGEDVSHVGFPDQQMPADGAVMPLSDEGRVAAMLLDPEARLVLPVSRSRRPSGGDSDREASRRTIPLGRDAASLSEEARTDGLTAMNPPIPGSTHIARDPVPRNIAPP